jgi:hypothetical protein
MKPYSMALSTTECGPSWPTAFRIASSRPVCFLRRAQALLVGLHVGKVQRIGRAQAAIHQFIAGFEQQFDALAGADLEVMLALRANVQVGFEIGLEDGLAAAQALDPQALGAHVSFAGSGPVRRRGRTRTRRLLA